MPGAIRTTPLCRLAVAVQSVANARAILVDSTPAFHATIPAGHEAMTLRFNARIDRERSRLTLVAPDQSETRSAADQPWRAGRRLDLPPGSRYMTSEMVRNRT